MSRVCKDKQKQNGRIKGEEQREEMGGIREK